MGFPWESFRKTPKLLNIVMATIQPENPGKENQMEQNSR